MIWFTADQHFGWDGITNFRPVEMQEALVQRHNSRVSPEDIVCYLGDFGDIRFLEKLNGIPILVKGNHDKHAWPAELNIAGFKCRHMPAVGMLHGHSHGNRAKGLDVGVDAQNYYPISIEEVRCELKNKQCNCVSTTVL